jgi:hypothetical protein
MLNYFINAFKKSKEVKKHNKIPVEIKTIHGEQLNGFVDGCKKLTVANHCHVPVHLLFSDIDSIEMKNSFTTIPKLNQFLVTTKANQFIGKITGRITIELQSQKISFEAYNVESFIQCQN